VSYLVYARESTELIVELPFGATLLMCAVDGELMSPRFLDENRVALSLGSGSGLHCVRLRWAYSGLQEPVARPNIQAPYLEAAPALQHIATLTVPAGFQVAEHELALIDEPTLASIKRDLAYAEALANATELLVQQYLRTPEDTLKAAILSGQAQFAKRMRLALAGLDGLRDVASTTQAAEIKVSANAVKLHNVKQLRDAGLEKLRIQAEKVDLAAVKQSEPWLLPAQGSVLRWRMPQGTGPTVLDLAATEPDGWLRLQKWAPWLLLATAVLLSLTALPRAVEMLAVFWPEQVTLIALVGWHLWGFSPVAAVLLFTGATARLALIIVSVRRGAPALTVAGDTPGSSFTGTGSGAT
jgi:hypothetical protein